MQAAKMKKTLYISREEKPSQGAFEQAQAYCKEYGYRLWKGEPCQSNEPGIALDWAREIMTALGIHLLLLPFLPSLERIIPACRLHPQVKT